MKIPERLTNFMEKAKSLNRKQLTTWTYSLYFLICVSIFGVFWFLKQKKLGIALMVVFLICLGFIMYLKSKLPQEEKREEEKPDPKERIPPGAKKIIKKEKEVKNKMPEEEMTEIEEQNDGFEFGLPSSEEYNKRLNDAFEFKGLGIF